MLNRSEPYSIGLLVMQLQLPVKEGTTNYSIHHIGCICLAFLLCVFSDVSLTHLGQSRHSHIGCTYLTFLHCGFVKCLHKLLA